MLSYFCGLIFLSTNVELQVKYYKILESPFK